MKLSLKVEYACRVLAQLGKLHRQGGLSNIDKLAEAEDVPANYLVQILNELRNGGLIVSRRGKQGGYALARSPEKISLAEIIHIIEGEVLDFNVVAGQGESGKRVAEVWHDIAALLKNKTEQYTVIDLMPQDDDDMYYI